MFIGLLNVYKRFLCLLGYVCPKSSKHAHGTKMRGGNLKLLETTVGLAR